MNKCNVIHAQAKWLCASCNANIIHLQCILSGRTKLTETCGKFLCRSKKPFPALSKRARPGTRHSADDEVQHHEGAEHIHDGVDVFGAALDELDKDVNDYARAETVRDAAGEGGEHEHDAGSYALVEAGEVDIYKALEHEEADVYERGAGRAVGDGDEQGSEKHGNEEHGARDKGGQTAAAAGFDARR